MSMEQHVRNLVAAVDGHIFAPSTKTAVEETISYIKLRSALHEAQTALAEIDATQGEDQK